MGSIKKRYRIIIIEPYAIIASGLRQMVEGINQFEVVSVIADGCHYAERISSLRPDIVIINPSVVDFRKRHTVEDLFSGSSTALAALVYQHVEPDILKQYEVVIDIADNKEKIAAKLQLLISRPEQTSNDTNELSEREKEILIAVARGKMNKEIADMYHLSIHTVMTHRKNISRKTGIKSVSGITVFAILNNMIDINEIE